MKIMTLSTPIFFFFLSLSINAHEGMMTKGYFSCLACHQSSTGSGLLNSYGRGIARATSLRGGEYSPGIISQTLSVHGRLNQQIQGRIAHLDRKEGDRLFPMQADYLAAMQVSDSTEVALSVARAPKSARLKGREETVEQASGLSQFFIRKLMITQEINESLVLEVGRDYVSYGLRPEDHTLFFQANNRFGVTDFPTQLRAIWEGERSRHFLAVLAPSGQEVRANRERGMSLKNEVLLFDKNQKVILGINALKGVSDQIDRTLFGLHLKMSWGPILLLSQWDRNYRVLRSNDQSFWQNTGFARVELQFIEWFTPHVTREWLSIEAPFERRREGFGIGGRLRLSESVSFSGDYKEVKQGARVDKSFLTQAIFNIF
jgi:hypothetical protein